jgi:hypothetical protein
MFHRTVITTTTRSQLLYRTKPTFYCFATSARAMVHAKTLTQAIKEDHEEVRPLECVKPAQLDALVTTDVRIL